MNLIFLAEQSLSDIGGAGGVAAVLAILAAVFLFAVVASIVVYVYSSFAFMAIAKKVKYSTPGIAWVPAVGPLLITSKTAKMHWWPILLLIVFPIPYIGGLAGLAVAVFSIIWLWKTFEVLKRPGWWAILCIIPIVGLVMIGIAAWGDSKPVRRKL